MHLLIVLTAFFINGADPTDTHTVIQAVSSLQQCADLLNSHRIIHAQDGDTYYMTHANCRVAKVDKQGNVKSISPLPQGN